MVHLFFCHYHFTYRSLIEPFFRQLPVFVISYTLLILYDCFLNSFHIYWSSQEDIILLYRYTKRTKRQQTELVKNVVLQATTAAWLYFSIQYHTLSKTRGSKKQKTVCQIVVGKIKKYLKSPTLKDDWRRRWRWLYKWVTIVLSAQNSHDPLQSFTVKSLNNGNSWSPIFCRPFGGVSF